FAGIVPLLNEKNYHVRAIKIEVFLDANDILIGTKFYDSIIIQNIPVEIPEKCETAISPLEISKDISSITMEEVLGASKKTSQSNNNQVFLPCSYWKN
ncbi:hypothetical protein Lal_00041607, partial [Lupinus albus]